MKKRVVSAILIVTLGFSVVGCSAKQEEKKVAESAAFTIPVNTSDYEYEVYGRVVECQRLEGSNHGLAVIQPLYEGGAEYEGYEWVDCYVEAKVMDKLEKADFSLLDDQRAVHATIRNSADGGGFISLPEILIDYEEIEPENIPVWGGA